MRRAPFSARTEPACPRAAASFFSGSGPAPRRAHVRPAGPEDAARLARDLRGADRRELAALGREPLEAIEEAVVMSRQPLAAVGEDGRLVLLFGAAPASWIAEPGAGVRAGAPWMLATSALETISRPFLRACRGWTDHLGAPFDLLANCVDERNTVHIRWLRWCGFRFLRRLPLGPQRRPFLEFARLGGPQFGRFEHGVDRPHDRQKEQSHV